MLYFRFQQVCRPFALLFSNTAWLLSAEALAKLSRIITIVVLAGALTPISYGTAMLALAFHDMLAILLRAGAGTQIIRCNTERLEEYAKVGGTIQWCLCILLALIQFFSAEYIATIYNNPEVEKLLKTMTIIYLLYPLVSVKVFLLHRENKMRWFSINNCICIILENLSIAVFAFMGAGIMSVAYGKIVFAITWVLLFYRSPVSTYGIGFNFDTFREMLSASGKLLNTEVLRALRMHSDTFIAGKLLQPELFGLYTFAKNAGIGLSQSIGNVFNNALFPFLCKLERNNSLTEKTQFIYLITIAIGLIFVVQAQLVPIYLPIIFEEKWYSVIPIVTILCLSGLPSLVVDTFCSLQRVQGHFVAETYTRLLCLLVLLLMIFIYVPNTPMEFALVLFFSSLLWCVAIFSIITFKRHRSNVILFLIRRESNEQ